MTAKLLVFIRSHAFVLPCSSESSQWRWETFTILSISAGSCVFTQCHSHGCSLQQEVQLTTPPGWGERVQNWSNRHLLTKTLSLHQLLATHSLHFHWINLVATWPQDRSIWLAGLTENKGNEWNLLCSCKRRARLLFQRLLVFSSF